VGFVVDKAALGQIFSKYSRLSIIRVWFNRFAAQPRQCIFKEKILFSVSNCLNVLYASQC
jgi:hypothetical protein